MADDQLLYRRGRLSVAELNEEIDEFWQQLNNSAELQNELHAYGIDAGALLEIQPREAIKITPSGAGVDPSMVGLIIAFAPAVNHVVKSTWTDVLLPWIRR